MIVSRHTEQNSGYASLLLDSWAPHSMRCSRSIKNCDTSAGKQLRSVISGKQISGGFQLSLGRTFNLHVVQAVY